MTTVLVANRGEIAVRVFRTAKRMGMRTVAVYSEADADAPFVRRADEAIAIGPSPASESYLNIGRILEAAKLSGAELIHPGYGFLAENSEFAEACGGAGLTFVGPPADVLRNLGAKDEAKRIAQEAGVPVVTGYAGEDQSDEAFSRSARQIGFPIMIKPAEGGGGKGMTVVSDRAELAAGLAAARRIAVTAFGSDRLIIERYLTGARHVEVQFIGDSHGNLIHLGERDCSMQRRHQKIVEESPSPGIDDITRSVLCDAAIKLARHVGYQNAGTCEFVVGDDQTVSFLEVNARLQVEHPVTEMVTGLDLVELQLRVAMGEKLPIAQENVTFNGHAFEARVYAEDPDEEFLPQMGTIFLVTWPDDARVDTGVEPGSSVTAFYDPMIAKVITHGSDRKTALRSLKEALASTAVLGIRTNLGFLSDVMESDAVRDGEVTTQWLETSYESKRLSPQTVPDEALALASAYEIESRKRSVTDPWQARGPFRLGAAHRGYLLLNYEGEEVEMRVERRSDGAYLAGTYEVTLDENLGLIQGRSGHVCRSSEDLFDPEAKVFVLWDRVHYEIGIGSLERRPDEGGPAHLEAPMPGQVIAVRVATGDAVKRGQDLVVVEAMKMEHTIKAPADGIIKSVYCAAGDQVQRGQALVDFEPT